MKLVEIERVDGIPVARSRQDIDAANVATIHDELAECVRPDSAGLILDLSETRYLDSAGLDMLFRLAERLDERRSALVLVIPEGSQLHRLVTIVGLAQAIDVRGDLDSALEAVRQGPRQRPAPPPAPEPEAEPTAPDSEGK